MERRSQERRRGDSPAPPVQERRKADRRKLVAGAGLLAALALTGPRVVSSLRGPHPGDGTVDVSTDNFRILKDDRAAVEAVIHEAAAAYGVSADLVKAVVQTESAFNPLAVSPVGAQGLMQLMPVTSQSLGVKDPFDPRDNVFGGVKYLSMLLDRFNGNVALALASYNAGPTVVDRHKGIPPFGETRGYVKKIRALVADTAAAFTLPSPPRPRLSLVARRAASRSAAVRLAAHNVRSVRGSRAVPTVRRAVYQRSIRKNVRGVSVRKASLQRPAARAVSKASATPGRTHAAASARARRARPRRA